MLLRTTKKSVSIAVSPSEPNPTDALHSVNDGVYIVNPERRIVYWGRSAERITGWCAEEVLGMRCSDNLLCHYDKDGHPLCGQEHCPLHRAMVTGTGSSKPLLVYTRHKNGREVPLHVSVAPVRNRDGHITGGVETFRDLTSQQKDFQRVKKIQSLSFRDKLPPDAPVRVRSHHIPCDLLGGDYYAVGRLDENLYGFLLGDVAGHGVAAALYTMYLSSLWQRHAPLVQSPAVFAQIVNRELCDLIREEEPFAACLCGVMDVAKRQVRLTAAGNPPPLLVRRGGRFEIIACSGLPFGLDRNASGYDEIHVPVHSGDRLLMFTDGVTEVHIESDRYLNTDGLIDVLQTLGYPDTDVSFLEIEKELLRRSDGIRFADDITFLELLYR
ncbi:MAG: SpoIIE family protein phosphatase [Phycisphaerae bacterium]|nr:SpoIIE family protein phosphatase [Phycisphaerae bacterium]